MQHNLFSPNWKLLSRMPDNCLRFKKVGGTNGSPPLLQSELDVGNRWVSLEAFPKSLKKLGGALTGAPQLFWI